MTSLLNKELAQLEKQLLALTAMVEENVQRSFKALTQRDTSLAKKLIESEQEINRDKSIKIINMRKLLSHNTSKTIMKNPQEGRCRSHKPGACRNCSLLP